MDNLICNCDEPKSPETLLEAQVWGMQVQIHTTCHREYADQIIARDAVNE